MAISGGIKYFQRSKCLLEDGTSISATTGDASADFALDKNKFTYYRSVGSTDATTETIEITMPSSVEINRLIIIDHNWKQFTAKYHNGTSFVDFTSVVGLDASLGSVSETTFADDTAYYEFASVTTSRVQLTVTTTQVANAQKYANQIILTKELGTLAGYPIIKSFKHERGLRTKTMLSGRSLIQKGIDSIDYKLDFRDYPPSLSADVDLMFTLHDLETDFLSWICGGRRGTTYFKKTLRGWRLRDVIPTQIDRDISVSYSRNVYLMPVNLSVSFTEHV